MFIVRSASESGGNGAVMRFDFRNGSVGRALGGCAIGSVASPAGLIPGGGSGERALGGDDGMASRALGGDDGRPLGGLGGGPLGAIDAGALGAASGFAA